MSESALLFLAYSLIQLAPDRYLLSLRKMWHEMFHEDVQTCQHKKLQNCWAVRARVHCWLMDRPFSAEPFHLVGLHPALVQEAISPQVEDSLFLFIKCHKISPGTFLQPLELPFNGSTNQITATQLPSRPVPYRTLTSRSLNGSKWGPAARLSSRCTKSLLHEKFRISAS